MPTITEPATPLIPPLHDQDTFQKIDFETFLPPPRSHPPRFFLSIRSDAKVFSLQRGKPGSYVVRGHVSRVNRRETRTKGRVGKARGGSPKTDRFIPRVYVSIRARQPFEESGSCSSKSSLDRSSSSCSTNSDRVFPSLGRQSDDRGVLLPLVRMPAQILETGFAAIRPLLFRRDCKTHQRP